jgi:hypothetical protein
MAKTLRVRTSDGWVTKAVEDLLENSLTAEEIDDNFLELAAHAGSTDGHPVAVANTTPGFISAADQNKLDSIDLDNLNTVINYFVETTEVTEITEITNVYNEVINSVGFVDPASVSMSFVDGTRTFTIEPAEGYTSFIFYSFGTRYEKTEAESIQIDDVNGLWYISYNSSGVLVASQTIWDLSTQMPVASVLWDNGTGDVAENPGGGKPNKFAYIYVIATSFPFVPTDAQTILYHTVVGGESVELARRLPYSLIKCKTAPTAEAVFSIKVNDVEKGTATIAIGETSGTFTWNTKVTLVGGDIVEIIAPATADATLECIAITIRGIRV